MYRSSETGPAGRRHQRGDILLESMIAVLLAGIMGGGMAWISARALDSQREARSSRMVVEALRNQLLDRGLGLAACAGTGGTAPTLAELGLPGALLAEGVDTKAVTVECDEAGVVSPTTITLDGVSPASLPPQLTLKVAAADVSLDAGPDVTLGSRQ